MSAWAVFSMMGLYPDCPGEPYYTLTSPVFDRVEVDLDGGKTLTITADRETPDDIYISSMKLGGKPLKKYRIEHSDLINGGNLHLNLTSAPKR